MKPVDVLILAGGLGTRLKPVISDRPKVLAPVGNKPFVSILLNQLRSAGFRRVILCTGHMASQVEDEFGVKYKGMTIAYSKEARPLGTGGALRRALPLITTKLILVMNGDSFIDQDLNLFLRWFNTKSCNAALVLTKMCDSSRFGRVHVDLNGLITAFKEKNADGGPGWVNAGVYIIKKSVIETIPEGKTFSIEEELFPNLAGKKLYGHCSEGKFIDIGLPKTYAESETFFRKLYIH